MDKVFVFVSEDYLMKKIFSNALFEAKERESAVSPVVGVMLMLVVTIIIAATVSAFAGGLVGTTDKAPQVALDVKINNKLVDYTDDPYGYGPMGTIGMEPTLAITHLGGDPIDTSRLKIITMWTNRTTQEPNYRETTALPSSDTPQEYKTGKYVNLTLTTANVQNMYNSKYHEPYLLISGQLPGSYPDVWFGNFILKPGDVMKAQGSLGTVSNYYATESCYDEYSVIKDAMLLSGRDVVNVKLIDIPTGQIVFEKDVYVTEG